MKVYCCQCKHNSCEGCLKRQPGPGNWYEPQTSEYLVAQQEVQNANNDCAYFSPKLHIRIKNWFTK